MSVHTALSIIEAGWGIFLKPFQVEGARVTHNKYLAEMVAAAGPVVDNEALHVASVLAAVLPPKGSQSFPTSGLEGRRKSNSLPGNNCHHLEINLRSSDAPMPGKSPSRIRCC